MYFILPAGYLRKLNKILQQAEDLPQPIKDAIKHQDFSNVTSEQIRNVNVSVLEYIPVSVKDVYILKSLSLLQYHICT